MTKEQKIQFLKKVKLHQYTIDRFYVNKNDRVFDNAEIARLMIIYKKKCKCLEDIIKELTRVVHIMFVDMDFLLLNEYYEDVEKYNYFIQKYTQLTLIAIARIIFDDRLNNVISDFSVYDDDEIMEIGYGITEGINELINQFNNGTYFVSK